MFGEKEIAAVTILSILEKANLSEEEEEILFLRGAYGWYFEEIGEFIGYKYRGKPYSEGSARKHYKKVLGKIALVINQNNLK